MATAHPLSLHAPDDLDVAPLDWNDFTSEERAEIEQSLAGVATSRAKLVPHADVQRALAELRRQGG